MVYVSSKSITMYQASIVEKPVGSLYELLKQIDEQAASGVHPNNSRKVNNTYEYIRQESFGCCF